MEKSEAHQLYLEPSLILRTYRFLRILFVINIHPGEILFTSRSPLNKALLFRLKFPGSLKEPVLDFRISDFPADFGFRISGFRWVFEWLNNFTLENYTINRKMDWLINWESNYTSMTSIIGTLFFFCAFVSFVNACNFTTSYADGV